MRLLLLVLLFAPCRCYHKWESIYHKITQEPEYSGFHLVIKPHRKAILNLYYSSLTVFVPENDAIDDFDDDFSESLSLYHMGVGARTLKQLIENNTVHSMGVINPPLWITVSDGYYVNNARIIEARSNYAAKSQGSDNVNQVLHVIDDVLDHSVDASYSSPTAYDFLQHHNKWRIRSNKVNRFFEKVKVHRQEKWYNRSGPHTYFVPVDKMDDRKLESIDSYIIQGHVVPHLVLFTRPTAKNYVYDTAANDDYVSIVLCFTTINRKNYVRSYTVATNGNHQKGQVLAEIVQGDIPLANGVVHLIDRPLAVFDRKLKPFPYLPVLSKITSDPTLNLTFTLGRSKVNKMLSRPGTFTYFAPRDLAWTNVSELSSHRLQGILERHFVSGERYGMAQLVAMSPVTLNTLGGPLKVNVTLVDDSYFVGWNKNTVRVHRPDYECSDGVVHVMDGVFGVATYAATGSGGFWGALKDLVT